MAAVSWKTAVSGSWTTSTKWSPGTVPVSTSAVTIGVTGFYTVSLSGTSQSVHSLNISDPDATLAVAAPGHTETVATTLNNGGALNVDVTGKGGTKVAVGGLLTNSGDLDIGNKSITGATTVTAGGLTNTTKGTINIVGGTAQAALKINAAAPATWNGSAFLTGNAVLQFSKNGITKIAGDSEISLDGAQARVALAATPGSNSALTKLGTNAGIWVLDDGARVGTSVALANQGTLTVDNGSALSIGGVLTNTGSLGIGDSKLGLATTLTATGFVNTGTLTVTGSSARATLNITGPGPTTVTGSWAIAGDATVRFGSGGITMVAAGGALSLDGARARLALSATPGSNSALTKLGSNAGLFSLADGAAVSTTVGFTNSDITQIDCVGFGGSTFAIGGTLTNSGSSFGGGTVIIGNTATTAATNVTATGLVNDGSINLAGGTGQTELAIAAAAAGTLTGDFGLTGNALLQFGSGAIGTIGDNGTLSLDGTQARVAVSGTSGSNSALTTLSTNDGSFSLNDGAAVNTTVGFTNNGVTNIDNSGTGGSRFIIGGTLTNRSEVVIGNTATTAATTVTATGLVNDGSINLAGGTGQAELAIAAAVPATLTGSYVLTGNALLQFGGGAITAIGGGGGLTLDGAQARVAVLGTAGSTSALTTLGSNAGEFNLADGAAVSTTGGFSNSGFTGVDNFGTGGSSLSIGGLLNNSGGDLSIGNTALVASTTVTATGLVNTGGLINLTGGTAGSTAQAELSIGAVAPGTLTGTVDLSGNALLLYTTGAITTIGDNGGVRLDGAQAEIAVSTYPGSNTALTSALTPLGRNFGTLQLADGASVSTKAGANFNNSGTTEIDSVGAGGSTFAIGGTLTNSGDVIIGNTATTAATTVTATGLVNDGFVELTGGAAQAELAVAGAAPGTLIGDFDLSGNALLQFGSGAITAIGSDGGLTLDGTQARVVVSGTAGSTSALTTVGTNAGYFDLRDGASLSTTVGFNNRGATRVDTFGTGGGTFAIGGTLINSGDVNIGNTATTAATTVTATGLVNGGSIELTGGAAAQAELAVAGAAPSTLIGSFDLTGNALLQFGSGAITAIGNFSGLTLDGAQARVTVSGTGGSASALTTLGTNAGSFTLADGAAVSTTVGFSNSGFTGVDSFGTGGSSLIIGGTLINDGGVSIGNGAMLGATTVTAAGLVNTHNGSIDLTGGTGPAELLIAAAAPATLIGNVDLTGNALLQFGSGAIGTIGRYSSLTLDGAQAHVAVSGTTGSNSALTTLGSNAGSFTLDDGAAVSTTGGFNNIGAIQIDNFGTGGSSLAVGGSLNNRGTLEVDTGTTGSSSVTIVGTLTNSGAVVIGNFDMLAATTVTAAGLVNTGGAINLTGGEGQAELLVAGAAPGTLTGTVDLSGNALLQFGSGAITAIGTFSGLTLDGAQALVASGTSGGNSALTTLSSNAGLFSLDDGASFSTTTGFNNSGDTNIDGFGSGGSSFSVAGPLNNSGFLFVDDNTTGSSSVIIGGILTNSGDVFIGNSAMLTATTVTAVGLVNTSTGFIELTGGVGQAELLVGGAAPGTLTGTVELNGNALVQFGSGAISTIGTNSGLFLNGAQAHVALSGTSGSNSALTALSSNAGTFSLTKGVSVSTTGSFSNSGTTDVDRSGSGGSSFTIGQTLTNSGSFVIGNSGMLGATTVTATGLVNTGSGSIDLTGGVGLAELLIAGAAPGTLTGTVQLSGNALLQFGSGAITTIGTSSGLTLDGTQALVALSGAPGSNSALTTLGSNAGTFTLADGVSVSTTVGFNNSGTTNIDGFGFGRYGGSSLAVGGPLNNSGVLLVDTGTTASSSVTIAGILTNSDQIFIGNAAMLTATTVTAAGLLNTGTGFIDLTGGVGQAELLIAGPAPGTLTGTVELNGNALLQFGSGAITTIAAGSELALNGAQAFVALSGTSGSNSALTTLGSNAGVFSLADGVSVSIVGSFSNSGTTDIDRSGPGGSSLAIGGTLTNSGHVYIGNFFSTATTVTAAGIVNTGGAAVFEVQGASVSTPGTGGFNNSGITIIGNSLYAGGSLTIGGTLTNSNFVEIFSGSKTATVTAASLVNTGVVALFGGTALAELAVAAAAPAILTGGYELFDNSLLQFGSGAITAIGNTGFLYLNGAQENVAISGVTGGNSALTTLGSNAGTFELENGAAVSTTGGFSNSGFTRIDNNFFTGGSSLAVGGPLTNSNSVVIGNSALTAATNVQAAALINNAAAAVTVAGNTGAGGSNATLTLTGASSDAGTVNIDRGGILALGNTLGVTGALGLFGGTISGGTLAGAGSISLGSGNTGTLQNVTVGTGATVTVAATDTLVESAVTVNGALSGTNATLTFAQNGIDPMTNTAGFATINLANGAANSLTLAASNFAGVSGNVITINDGDSGNTVNGSTLASPDAIIVHAGAGADSVSGGTGNDVFFAGGNTTMHGGTGTNQFTFANIGNNTITDFAASGTNELVFSNSGFNLGFAGATSTPTLWTAPEIAAHFSTGAGTFASASAGFDYTGGNLFFSATGSASNQHLVAALTGAPAINPATQLFFIT